MMILTLLAAAIDAGTALSVSVSATVAVGLAIGGLVVSSSRANRAKIDALEKAVIELQLKIEPFWKTFEAKIADALHHPGEDHKELDELLEELKAGTITPARKTILKEILKKLCENAPSDAAEKADLLLKVMPMVEKEAAGELPPTDTRTIEQKKEAERVNGAPA